MKRWLIRLSSALIVALVVLIIWGWMFSWRRLPYYTKYGHLDLPVPIMTEEEYGRVFETHTRPYVVELQLHSGGILLYGATHTKDPADPQIADIEARWKKLRPTVALCESRLGILFPGLMNPIKEFSEPGFIHHLARREKIPSYTWEPVPSKVMEYLFSLPFSKEQVALRVKLGPYFSNRRFGKPTDPEAFVRDYLGNTERWPGLENTLATVADIDAAWKRYFPNGPDWREVSDESDLPGFLKDISSNAARDQHFARVIIDLVNKGERIFAIAGFSHAVKLEPALRGFFDPNEH